MENKKTVLVTGASGKIGNVFCERLVDEGYDVIALTRTPESKAILQKKFPQKIEVRSLDLCEVSQRQQLFDSLKGREIYGLINNARSLSTLVPAADGSFTHEQFRREFDLGVWAPNDLTLLLAKDFGLKRVINISSIYGVVASNPNLYRDQTQRVPVHYGVVKAALIHLTKELAVRLSPQDITVNAISFGGVEGRVDDEFQRRYANLCPQASMLKLNELAGAAIFLLSSDASAITGHNLMVDGGWTLW